MQALHFGFNYLHTLSSTADNHRNCSSPWMQRWTSKNTTWGGKKKKKKGHTAAVFHSVCKYCFLVKLCCESQESIRGSEILREINNMLGFSTTELKVISDPRKHRITIKVVFLYLLLLHFCPWWKTFPQKPWAQTLCRSVQLHSDVHAASR